MTYLFVGGCPRSGTTAMRNLLDSDHRIALGLERFKFVPGTFTAQDMRPERLFNPTKEETNFVDPALYERARQKLSDDTILYVGDKVPIYVFHLASLRERFPYCRLIAMHRQPAGVAASFEARARNPADGWPAKNDHRAAVEFWNRSLRGIEDYTESFGTRGLRVISYERFFSGESGELTALFDFLRLPLTADIERAYAAATAGWLTRGDTTPTLDEPSLDFVEAGVDRDLEARVLQRFGLSPSTRV